VPQDTAAILKDGLIQYTFQHAEPGAYKDVRALYGDAITASGQ
jgi:hypothetical protein